MQVHIAVRPGVLIGVALYLAARPGVLIEVHLEITWRSLGEHLEATWRSLGGHLEATWRPLGGHLEATWRLSRPNRRPEAAKSAQVELERRPRGSKWSPRGAQEAPS